MMFMMIEKQQMIRESQKDQTQSPVRVAIGLATRVPKKVARRLMESCRPMAMAKFCVRNHLDKIDSCMVTIRPEPIPKMTRPATIKPKESYLAAMPVNKLPMMTIKLTASVPQTEPKISIKIPPKMGKMVLIIETEEEITPYRVLSI